MRLAYNILPLEKKEELRSLGASNPWIFLLILLHYFYLPIFHLKRQFYFCFVIIFIKLRNFEVLFVFTVFFAIWQKWHMTALIRTMDLTVQNTFFSCIHTVFLPGIAIIKCSPGIRIGIHCSELAWYFPEGSHNFNTIYLLHDQFHSLGFFESIFVAIASNRDFMEKHSI